MSHPDDSWATHSGFQQLGLAAFSQKHGPYWDIPLNESLPQPVIDLPVPAAPPGAVPTHRPGELFDFQTAVSPTGSGVLFTEQPVASRIKKGKKL